MKNTKDPSFTVFWEGKQPAEKLLSSFVAAAETCEWKIKEKDSYSEGILDPAKWIREEYSFTEDDTLIGIPLLSNPMEGTVKCEQFLSASTTVLNDDSRTVDVEIWLQAFHRKRKYDSCDMYLFWREVDRTEQVMLRHISHDRKAYSAVVSFLECFRKVLRSEEDINEVTATIVS